MTDLPMTPCFRLDGRRALVRGAHVMLTARADGQVEAAADALRAKGLYAAPAALDVIHPDGGWTAA